MLLPRFSNGGVITKCLNVFSVSFKTSCTNISFFLSTSLYTYCQNPNLTTTQPQPNLNPVGFDTIITLHPPPPPPPPPTGTLILTETRLISIVSKPIKVVVVVVVIVFAKKNFDQKIFQAHTTLGLKVLNTKKIG